MTEQPESASRHHSTGEVAVGFAQGIAMVIAGTLALGFLFFIISPLLGPLSMIGLWLVFGFGVSQFIYMLPAILIARRRGRTGLAKGLIIAASLAFLLNASCFVLFWSGKMGRIAG